MDQKRVICFIDGFNLYHAIKNLNKKYLKWVNLWALSSVFIRPRSQKLIDVIYFSSYADWLPLSKRRHLDYVNALISSNVKPIMGKFKKKDRKCPECGHKWCGHEEKETDVNIALSMLDLAYKDQFDHLFLITNDSDLAPAIRMIRKNFPLKQITTISPPHYMHSNELIQASSDKAKITIEHLERCLFPESILDSMGNEIVKRPEAYNPPLVLVS